MLFKITPTGLFFFDLDQVRGAPSCLSRRIRPARKSGLSTSCWSTEPAGSGLELTHFAIESATELLSVLPKLPDHHPEDFKHSFRADDRIGLVLRLQHDPAPFAVQSFSV